MICTLFIGQQPVRRVYISDMPCFFSFFLTGLQFYDIVLLYFRLSANNRESFLFCRVQRATGPFSLSQEQIDPAVILDCTVKSLKSYLKYHWRHAKTSICLDPRVRALEQRHAKMSKCFDPRVRPGERRHAKTSKRFDPRVRARERRHAKMSK